MSTEIPLGRREADILEFKAADAANQPADIGRAAVAMLNATGGEIWIGLREGDGGQAVEIQPIRDAARARERVENHLLDTIDPKPVAGEVLVELVDLGGGGHILRVRLKPTDDRKPYAQMIHGALGFVIRFGARTRPMTREEVFLARRQAPREDRLAEVAKEMIEEREKVRALGRPRFYVRVRTSPPLSDHTATLDALASVFVDPDESGSRRSGWNCVFEHERPRLRQGRYEQIVGSEQDPSHRLTVESNGGVCFLTSLDRLWWGVGGINRSQLVYYPWALIELIGSTLRFARTVLRRGWATQPSEDTQILVDVALLNARGWTLWPGAPGTYGFEFRMNASGICLDDFLGLRIRQTTFSDFLERPELVSVAIVREIYQAYGYGEDRIPPQFDQTTGRLALPARP